MTNAPNFSLLMKYAIIIYGNHNTLYAKHNIVFKVLKLPITIPKYVSVPSPTALRRISEPPRDKYFKFHKKQ